LFHLGQADVAQSEGISLWLLWLFSGGTGRLIKLLRLLQALDAPGFVIVGDRLEVQFWAILDVHEHPFLFLRLFDFDGFRQVAYFEDELLHFLA
jgi:hypothetical protein